MTATCAPQKKREVVHRYEIPLDGGLAHLDVHVWSDGVTSFWLHAAGVTTTWHATEDDTQTLCAEMARGLAASRKARGLR